MQGPVALAWHGLRSLPTYLRVVKVPKGGVELGAGLTAGLGVGLGVELGLVLGMRPSSMSSVFNTVPGTKWVCGEHAERIHAQQERVRFPPSPQFHVTIELPTVTCNRQMPPSYQNLYHILDPPAG